MEETIRWEKGSGQPWFFYNIINNAAESRLPVIELGASWEILSLPVFHAASGAKIVTFQPDLSEFEKLTSSFHKNQQTSIFPFGLLKRKQWYSVVGMELQQQVPLGVLMHPH